MQWRGSTAFWTRTRAGDERVIDVAIVGAGMAGASLAAALAPHRSVVLLEAEDRPGHHATGRSAAFWTESYGGPAIRPLTMASRPELERLGVLTRRGALHIARSAKELAAFAGRFKEAGRMFAPVQPQAVVPGLAPEWTDGLSEPTCADIDVATLHAHYLATARQAGARLAVRWRLAEGHRAGEGWRLSSESGHTLETVAVVNAAGAWADEVAARCGVTPLGLQPKRRTVLQLRLGSRLDDDGPLVLAADESFYWKPVGGNRVWLSPGDEGPSAATDAAPEEVDVATALDRFGRAVDWPVETVERRWAGLRTFAPDRLPVIGRDRRAPDFVWFAGQGGWGIQTAPAAAVLGAQAVEGETGAFSPGRFG